MNLQLWNSFSISPHCSSGSSNASLLEKALVKQEQATPPTGNQGDNNGVVNNQSQPLPPPSVSSAPGNFLWPQQQQQQQQQQQAHYGGFPEPAMDYILKQELQHQHHLPHPHHPDMEYLGTAEAYPIHVQHHHEAMPGPGVPAGAGSGQPDGPPAEALAPSPLAPPPWVR